MTYVIYILYYTPFLTYVNNYLKKYTNQEFSRLAQSHIYKFLVLNS